MTEAERQKHMSYIYNVMQQMRKVLNLSNDYFVAMAMTEAAAHGFYGDTPYANHKELSETMNGKKAMT